MTSPIPAAALDGALAIIGATGAGKTYVAKGAVEQLLALGRRVCIIDPLDVWYGLRTSADGERPAYPVVVFGGEHADVPISVDAGAELGRLIAEGVVQFSIICTAEMTGGEKARFLTPFFEALYAANKAPLHLVVDEADEVAPQSPMPEVMRLKGAVDKIARRGRVKGFRLLTITQRPAVLDKSVLSQIGTLVAMKLTSPQDRKAIEGWIKGNADEDQAKAVLASLAGLGRGEGWVWSPAAGLLERVTFPTIGTLDTSRTPEHGETIVEARASATVDIEAIRKAMSRFSTSNEAGKLNPPHGRAEPSAKSSEDMQKLCAEAEERGYQRGLAEGEAWGRRNGHQNMRAAMRAALDAIDLDETPAGSLVRDAGTPSTTAGAEIPVAATARRDSTPAGLRPLNPAAPKPSVVASADGTLSPTARKILVLLEQVHPVSLTFKAAALRVGASPRSSQFRSYERELRASGLVAADGDRLRAVSPAAGGVPAPADPIELYASRMPPSQAEMLRAIARAAPGSLRRDQIADRAGVSRTSSGLGNGLRELAAMSLIVGVDGEFVLSRELQEGGERG